MSKILNDGHSTILTFDNISNVNFLEKEVTPPGADGGGENDITTMRNVRWRTRQSKKLLTLTSLSITVAYDPAIMDDVVDQFQVNQLVTVTYPDGSTLDFFGWIDSFVPGTNVEGEQPTAELVVIPSNQDLNENEIAPVYTDAP